MSDETQGNSKASAGGPPERLTPFDLRLGSVRSCRQTMARIVREYSRGKIEEKPYKSLIWGVSQLVAYWRLENEAELLARIEKLEEIAGGLK